MSVFELPLSVRLAAWAGAVLRGAADPQVAVRVVTGPDSPHLVVWEEGEPVGLTGLWAALARRDVERLQAVLPAPGDPLGLPGPAGFNREALDAGEAVIAEGPSGAWGIVPDIETYGSVLEPGRIVRWRVSAVDPPRVTVVGSVGEAELALRTALRTATEELTRLDLTSWSPDVAARLDDVRRAGPSDGELPPDLAPRSVRVVATALRVRAIVDLASADDGGAVTVTEATARHRTLLDLDRVCRHALMAAVNEPPRR